MSSLFPQKQCILRDSERDVPFEKGNAREGIKHGAFSLTKGWCAFSLTEKERAFSLTQEFPNGKQFIEMGH